MDGKTLLLAALVAVAASTVSPALFQKLPAPQKSVWFALSEEAGSDGKFILDRLAIVSDGKLSKVPDDCNYNDATYKQFFAEYLDAGHTYSVLFGGAAAGSTVAHGPEKDSAISADYTGSARIRGPVMGLATNALISQAGVSSRQAPTPEERQSASDLARNLFAKAGVPPDLLAKIKVRNLTHTLLFPSESPSLIGSFFIEAGGQDRPTHNLFFIATLKGSALSPELVWTKISKDQLESDSVTFVDQADLFGGGEEEVIVLDRGWEGYVYRIYRRTKDDASRWEPIFETGIFGCA